MGGGDGHGGTGGKDGIAPSGAPSCAVACAPRQLCLAVHSPGDQEAGPGGAAGPSARLVSK